MRSVPDQAPPRQDVPDAFQLPPVSPAFCTGSLWKVTTLFRRRWKSPWSPTSLFFPSMTELLTAAMQVVLRLIDGNFRERYRCYRKRNLTGAEAIIP